MTKNEYIASIMLEAADLLKEENGSATKKFYVFWDELDSNFLLLKNRYEYGHYYFYNISATVKDCILNKLKMFGDIKNNVIESNYVRSISLGLNNNLYEIIASKYFKDGASYNIRIKDMINIKKIKTYENIEELAKDVGLKVSYKKLNLLCNKRKKAYDIAYKYLNSLKNKAKIKISFNENKENEFLSGVGASDNYNYFCMAFMDFHDEKDKVKKVEIVNETINVINKNLNTGYVLEASYGYLDNDYVKENNDINNLEYIQMLLIENKK